MPIFRYEATTAKGRRRRDSVEAADMEGAIAQLREMGLDPVVIKELNFEDRTLVRSEPPPLPPRSAARAWNFRVLFGAPFVLAGVGALFGLVLSGQLFLLIFVAAFGVVGSLLLVSGWRAARRWQRVVRLGQATTGAVTATGYNTSMRVNGRPAYRLRYSYQVGGQRHDGQVSTFSKGAERYADGDGLWVLYDPERPEVSAPWPALRPA